MAIKRGAKPSGNHSQKTFERINFKMALGLTLFASIIAPLIVSSILSGPPALLAPNSTPAPAPASPSFQEQPTFPFLPPQPQGQSINLNIYNNHHFSHIGGATIHYDQNNTNQHLSGSSSIQQMPSHQAAHPYHNGLGHHPHGPWTTNHHQSSVQMSVNELVEQFNRQKAMR